MNFLQIPEIGYYFLRLTSDRLLENHARLKSSPRRASPSSRPQAPQAA